jgi:hypothetical protein
MANPALSTASVTATRSLTGIGLILVFAAGSQVLLVGCAFLRSSYCCQSHSLRVH